MSVEPFSRLFNYYCFNWTPALLATGLLLSCFETTHPFMILFRCSKLLQTKHTRSILRAIVIHEKRGLKELLINHAHQVEVSISLVIHIGRDHDLIQRLGKGHTSTRPTTTMQNRNSVSFGEIPEESSKMISIIGMSIKMPQSFY